MDEQQKRAVSPLTLFYSYAHEDELLRNELEKHLSLLHRQGLISEWHDRQILAGDEWAHDIDQHLETSSIILLLISSDFLASNYCYDIEMRRALERHQRGEARVIPIILRPCDWRTSPFARLQCLPRDGKAVTAWQNQDEAFLVVVQGLRRVIERHQIPIHLLPEVERKNRMRLMKRMRATWIEGVLEHSLHQAALIALDLQEQPDALANPWHLEIQETNLPPHPLPPGTSIVEAYDEADGELLILGEPGAGKTTLLLELARTLLDRAEADEHHRIPVAFNLSSWRAKENPSLAAWLVEELSTKYQIPRKIARAWIDGDQVLALLDGLDEVVEQDRSTCAQAINTYHQNQLENGLALLVVCCRSKEYMALPTRVNLHQAVSIQPLTLDQIERYLQSAKGQLEALRQVLREDTEFYELARQPLMLSIFTLAYQGVAPTDLPTEGTREAQQQRAFAAYVERMLSHRHVSQYTSNEQICRWLTLIARRSPVIHVGVDFLQPWMLTKRQEHLCRVVFGLIDRLLRILLIGLLVGLLIGLLTRPFGELLAEVLGGLLSGLLSPFVSWIMILAVSTVQEQLLSSWGVLVMALTSALLGGLVSGLVGILLGLLVGILLGLLVGILLGPPLGALLIYIVFRLYALLKSFTLHLWLWRTGSLPWNLIAFLDEAAERLLLRKVGDDYIFIHRLLHDYFLSLKKEF